MHDSLTEEQLVDLALAGEGSAFEELVRRFQVPLKHYLQQHNRPADADDLVQETFLRAYRCLDRYDNRWRFSTWLYTIARRLSINLQQKRSAETNREDWSGLSSDAPDAPGEAMQAERCANLWRLARRVLSEPQWTALWLHYVEEMPLKEIARVQGRTTYSVKTMLFRARKRLKRQLAKESPGAADEPPGGWDASPLLASCMDAAQIHLGGSNGRMGPIDAEIIDEHESPERKAR